MNEKGTLFYSYWQHFIVKQILGIYDTREVF